MKNILSLLVQRWRAPKQLYLPAIDHNTHERYFWQGTLSLVMVMTTTIGVLADVSSLGMTFGQTTYKQVKSISSMLVESGLNKYSQGKMLKGLNPAWKIHGLQKTTLVFDKKEKLTAIIMTMNKQQFDRVLGFLKSKYQLVSKRIPFVGNKTATFRKENVTIEINAPHMSFNMDVVYSTNVFDRAYERIRNAKRRNKNQHEQSQF